MSVLASIFWRDLRLILRGGHAGLALAFLFLVITLLPFGLGPDLPLLRRLAPGFVWIAFLQALMLSLDRIFQEDLEDGSLDQYVLLTPPLEAIVLAKAAAHWVGVALPMLAAVPLAALMLNLDGAPLIRLTVALAIGAPALVMLGALGAAFGASVRRGGMLAILLVVPFYVPLVIFGAQAHSGGALLLLGLAGVASVFLVPVAAAAALRAAIRQ